jgi:hypothetical protein
MGIVGADGGFADRHVAVVGERISPYLRLRAYL